MPTGDTTHGWIEIRLHSATRPARGSDNVPFQGRVPTGTGFSFFLLLIRGNTFIGLARHFPPAQFDILREVPRLGSGC